MKKYRVKIKCPDFSVGQIVDSHPFCFGSKIACANYPELFEELKEPLFVTEDGVEIYNADTQVYMINKYTCSSWNTFTNAFFCKDFISDDNYLIYATKEAAEKWIDENKPVFSKKQIKAAIKKHTNFDHNGRYIDLNINIELGL